MTGPPTSTERSSRNGPTSIVIAAGGTGGHITPGLALADALGTAAPDARITFVGTSIGMEKELVPKAGHDLRLYTMARFNNQGWRKGLVPPALARGTLQARAILRDVAADVAISMGGYSGVPLVLGARLAGIPSIVFEPGAVPGQANRLAARFTDAVATAFPSTVVAGRDVRHVGFPLLPAMASFDRDAMRDEARRSFELDDRTTLVLVTGGSLGALSLNRLALGLAARWADRDDVRILLKAGSRTHDEIEALLVTSPGRDRVDLVRYIDRIDLAYAAADIALCRAGAGTVAELAVAELPSVLVPLPVHEHDEQAHNARLLTDVGGAIVVRDPEADADQVGPVLEGWMGDPAVLAAMRKGLATVARPDAAQALAGWVLERGGRG